jgi:hypothetical protein
MASNSKRLTASGEARYDVRYRAGSRAVEETFKRRQDAENRVRQIEAEKLNDLTPAVVRDWYSKVAANAGRDQAAKSYRLLRGDPQHCRRRRADRPQPLSHPWWRRRARRRAADDRRRSRLRARRRHHPTPRSARHRRRLRGTPHRRAAWTSPLRRRHRERSAHGPRPGQQVVGEGRIVTGPKSEAGPRTVSLPKVVVEALEKHLASYGQPGEDGVLFTGPRGEPITRALLSKEWQAARTAADAPEGLRIHDLRHHAATLTARMPGITTKELMGPHRSRVPESRADLPARNRTTRPRDRGLTRQRDHRFNRPASARLEPSHTGSLGRGAHIASSCGSEITALAS